LQAVQQIMLKELCEGFATVELLLLIMLST